MLRPSWILNDDDAIWCYRALARIISRWTNISLFKTLTIGCLIHMRSGVYGLERGRQRSNLVRPFSGRTWIPKQECPSLVLRRQSGSNCFDESGISLSLKTHWNQVAGINTRHKNITTIHSCLLSWGRHIRSLRSQQIDRFRPLVPARKYHQFRSIPYSVWLLNHHLPLSNAKPPQITNPNGPDNPWKLPLSNCQHYETP